MTLKVIETRIFILYLLIVIFIGFVSGKKAKQAPPIIFWPVEDCLGSL